MEEREKEEFNCWGHDFIYLFFSQFLDIGSSTGSLIIEALNIFRLFQRLSASKLFSTKISNSCLKYFNWARNIFQTIADSLFRVKPFTDFELFSIYNYVFPISILTFVLFAGHEIKVGFWVYFIFYILIISFGAGFGFIGINNLCTILLTIISGILLFIFCLLIYFHVIKENSKTKILDDKADAIEKVSGKFIINSSDDSEIEEIEIEYKPNKLCGYYPLNNFINTRSFILSCIIFTALIIPYSLYRSKLQYMIAVFIGIFVLIFFSVECLLIEKFRFTFRFEESHYKVICLFANFYSLFIVPNTEKFVEIMESFYGKKWNLIIGYIFNCLVNSLALSFFLIMVNYDEMVQKYKLTKSEKEYKFNLLSFYSLFEIGDTIRQIAYAILSAYDIIWACVGIEIAWFVLIVVFRPYRNVSDYTLAFGTTTILIISNGAILYTEYNDNKTFSFTITILLVFGACIPPVLSFILFFLFDFGREEVEINEYAKVWKYEMLRILSFSLEIFLSLSWLAYGFYIPMLFIHNDT